MTARRTTVKEAQTIPPPPGPEEGYDALVDYLHRYDPEELEKAGYLQEVSRKEVEDVTASAVYHTLREDGLHLKLSRKDCERLARFAAKRDISVETLVKCWIREGLAGSSRKHEVAKNKGNARR